MKALVLSGGRGTRLRPLTYSGAKQLVPIANKPVLFYVLEDLVSCGIEDIGIVVGDTADQIREAVGDGSRFGARVTYIPQDSPAGLAHAVKVAREYLGDGRFVMYLGDNFIQGGIARFKREYEASEGSASVLLYPVPNPELFGVAEVEGGRLVSLQEKPAVPRGNLALVGIYFFDATIHRAVESIRPSHRGELEITDAISWLIDNGHEVGWQQVSGWWIDTGKMDDLLEANRLVLATLEPSIEGAVDETCAIQGTVLVGKGASIKGSTLRGPLAIGAGTRVEQSYIGPFSSVGDNCLIRGSEVEHSIVMAGTRILDVPYRIDDSLIGRDVTVTAASSRPATCRLMLGDHSKVSVP